MSWTMGRRLTNLSVDGVTTAYITQNGNVIRQSRSGETIDFIYDAQQRPHAFIYNNGTTSVTYFYLLNLQGDVVALMDENGAVVAKYEYDAWGALRRLTDGAGNAITGSAHIAHINPLRYRGYYYDAETGFYYLQSRYYDPVIKRFINADSLVDTDLSSGLNMFSYCENNPVNLSDPQGDNPLAALAASLAPYLAALAKAIMAALLAELASKAIVEAVKEVVKAPKSRDDYEGYSVYIMRNIEDNEVGYVGITKNPGRRQGEHERDINKAHLKPLEVVFTGYTKAQARTMEQLLISVYTLKNLSNARREIAAGNLANFRNEIVDIINIFGGAVESEVLTLMGR